MLDLLAIGDIKLDTFVFIEDAQINCELKDGNCWLCLRYGEKLTLKKFETQIAGTAPNVAVALARLGLKSGVSSIVGHDATAHLAYATLKREKVAINGITEHRDVKSSFSIVLLYKGERTMLTSHSPHHYRLTRCPPTKWIYLSEMGEDYKEVFADVAAHVERKKIKLAFNPGTIQLRAGAAKLKPILRQTEVLFVNKEEGQALLRDQNHMEIDRMIHLLWKLGPKMIVVTDGKHGAYAFDGDGISHIDVFPAHRIETTGAGDSFSAGFLAALMHGKGIDEGLRWGAVNSASVIEFIGPQPGLLRKAEVLRRLKAHPKFQVKKIG